MQANDSPSNTKTKTKRKPRVVRSKAQWQSLLNDYQQSTMTQQAFCAQRGIAVSSFSKWQNRLSTQPDQPLFVDLGTIPESDNDNTCPGSPDWQVELELGKGIFLRVRTL
ncbi:MAG: hypothetical protein LPH21_04550 [Shewanella sp.]|nr:hypothetical protein [Shewanella sp.]